jgi:hypothetical protein
VSLIVKFLGDKITLYLAFLALLVVPRIKVDKEKNEAENKEAQNILREKVLSKIPKYSDLQKKRD